MKTIAYSSGYKYQLRETYVVTLSEIKPCTKIETEYLTLDSDGLLTIRKGYAWDGPSGPAIDTRTFMRGSLVHDALYQLIREGHLDIDRRKAADIILRRICREDGMWSWRAWWVYHGLRFFARPAADPMSRRPVIFAPKCLPHQLCNFRFTTKVGERSF